MGTVIFLIVITVVLWGLAGSVPDKNPTSSANTHIQQDNSNSSINHSNATLPPNLTSIDLYHGTTKQNTEAILREGGAFKVGERNRYGEGLHLTRNYKEAKNYADKGGKVLEMAINCPEDQIIGHDSVANSQGYKEWLRKKKLKDNSTAITRYCTEVLGKRFLKVDKEHYIALHNKTKENERVVFEGLYISDVKDA